MRPLGLIPLFSRVTVVLLFAVGLAAGTVSPTGTGDDETYTSGSGNPSPAVEAIGWNVNERELPLLNLHGERLTPGLAQSLAYRLDQFGFPMLQTLTYDDEKGRYLLPSFTAHSAANHFIEFVATDVKNTYRSTDASNLLLIDNDNTKTIRTSGGAKYLFVRYPDNEFRCALIKDANGASLNLLYTANGLVLRGIVDSTGRTVTFTYDAQGISAVTQTWMANSEGVTKTWRLGDPPKLPDAPSRYAHSNSLKALPTNAVIREFTANMAASDKLLAQIFGGPNAVAAGNGFEPAGLAASYPFYRGDIIGDDGIERRGHLSYAVHLYGNASGTGDSPLYVPAGFASHSGQPSPSDAVVTFYYPKLGSQSDVTLAVFHVADFQITAEGGRVRIGNLGGPGGSSSVYKHSHIEFYRGNTGLPALAARAGLRICPAQVFPAEVR